MFWAVLYCEHEARRLIAETRKDALAVGGFGESDMSIAGGRSAEFGTPDMAGLRGSKIDDFEEYELGWLEVGGLC